jgi:hypothetical protein
MTNVLEIYRGGEIIASIDIDTGAVFSEKLPGTDMISCPVLTKDVIDLQEEDYIFHKGNPYKIRILPDFGKDSSTIAKSYKIDFLAKFYDLIDIYVEHEGAHVFPYYGNARLQLEMCLSAANLNGATWTIGDIEETEDLLLKYDWTFIRPALDQIAEAFGLEWKAEGTTISMVKSVGRDTGLVFEIGRGKGLHEITRSSDTSKEKLTRIYGVGGTTNIDSKYREGKEPNLVFQERYVETPGAAAGTERVRMGKYENPDIYPRFEGTVTDVVYVTDSEGKITSCTITDPSIDFDVMAHMQEGVKGQVSFRTGPVTGIDFEISAASLSNKTITLVPFTDATGYYYPSATSQPEVGNKFTIIKMRMPNAYTIKAENELKEKSTIFLNDNKLQRIIYNAKPDESHLRNNMIALRAGDRVTLKDYDFGINQVLRFTEISYPLVNEYDITAVIGNEIRYDRVAKLFADVIQNKQQIQEVDRRGAVIAKRNSQNLKQLADSIFDADGNLDATKFNVGVLMAILAQFGLMSSDFLLNKVFITANFGGDINAVNISAGELIHMEYTHGGTENIWQMQPLTISGLVPGNKYYVYSKISATSNAGTFIVTTDQIKPNDNPGFYTLRTGIIYPVNDGYRDVDFTYGITSINGRQIRTGIIEGNTGALSLNLDTGDIFGKLTFRSSNGTIKDVAAVDNKAALADANALAAQITADNANIQASKAIAELLSITDDGVLDVSEKQTALKDWRAIEAERDVIGAQANIYGISTVDFTNKYNALNSYLTPLFANMSVNSDIDRQAFISGFVNYYTSRQNLLKAITEAAKTKTDQAQETASDAIADATDAQINAAIALTELADIADDGILDASEKVSELKNWRLIESELPLVQQQANVYGVSIADYNAKFTALGNYVTPMFANMNINSPIDRTEFINKFKDYYNARQAVYNAIANATKSLVDNISVGGRNTFSRDTPLNGNGLSAIEHNRPDLGGNVDNGTVGTPNGVFAVGNPNSLAVLRFEQVITSNGEWTVSGYVASNGVFDMPVDICDSADIKSIAVTRAYTYFEVTINVTNYDGAVYRFLDFNSIPYIYLYIKDLKIEKGNKATGWSAAPEDLQKDLDAAIAKGTEALRQLSEISNDGILDVSEKTTIRKEFEVIYYEKNILVEQANTFNVSSANYVAYWNTLINLLQNYWLADMTVATPVDRTQFNTAFENYYSNRANLYKFITDAANGKIVDINFGGTNLLKNSGEFVNPAYWYNANLGGTYIDGTQCIFTPNPTTQPMYYSEPIPLKPNTVYTYSGSIHSEVGYTGTRSSIQPMHFWLGNTPDTNSYNQSDYVISYDQVIVERNWKNNYVTFRTPNSGATVYFRPYVYIDINVDGRVYATYLQLEESSKATPWKKSAFQVSREAQDKANAAISAANAYADSVAQSKANIAQAAAIGAAQADAQSRAEGAYNNAVAASNAYAAARANEANSTAQIAAAADASNKATQAYNDAVANANTIYTALTNSLKGLAYQEFVELSKLGSTVVDNGRIKTVLIDAQGIWANIINAGFITAQQIEALNIAVTNLNAVSGTIGGLTISNNSVYSSNGNFSLTSAGALTAKSGQIGGFNIGTSELSSGNFVLSPSKNAAYFSENINGPVVASVGKNNAVIPNSPYAAPGVFMNELNQSVGENVALVVSAKNGALRNIALDIPNGSIRAGGEIGFTGYKRSPEGGTLYDKYVNGLFIKQGAGTNF